MKNFSIVMITMLMISGFSLSAGSSQIPESYLQQFQRNLMDSFIGHLSANGKTATLRQRAMFMGYILNRQNHRCGYFETDIIRMNSLTAEVKEFLQSVAPGEDLWPIVEAGMRGDYKQEVDTLLGGSAYVTPIFPTLDDMMSNWQNQDYNTDRYYNHPDNEKILPTVLTFLQLLREKRYQETLDLLAGRCYENLKEMAENSLSPETRARMDEYFGNLEWKAGLAGMTDTDPPMVRIMFALRDPDGDWEEDPCILVRDNGVWKIARFID